VYCVYFVFLLYKSHRPISFLIMLNVCFALLPASTGCGVCSGAYPAMLAVLVYEALHGTASRYLLDLLRRVADISSRSRFRSSSTSRLDVRPSCRVFVVDRSDRSFAVTGPRICNSPPGDITSTPSLLVFTLNRRLTCFDRLTQTLRHSGS